MKILLIIFGLLLVFAGLKSCVQLSATERGASMAGVITACALLVGLGAFLIRRGLKK
jgi:nitrate reductase gamma subunit